MVALASMRAIAHVSSVAHAWPIVVAETSECSDSVSMQRLHVYAMTPCHVTWQCIVACPVMPCHAVSSPIAPSHTPAEIERQMI